MWRKRWRINKNKVHWNNNERVRVISYVEPIFFFLFLCVWLLFKYRCTVKSRGYRSVHWKGKKCNPIFTFSTPDSCFFCVGYSPYKNKNRIYLFVYGRACTIFTTDDSLYRHLFSIFISLRCFLCPNEEWQGNFPFVIR